MPRTSAVMMLKNPSTLTIAAMRLTSNAASVRAEASPNAETVAALDGGVEGTNNTINTHQQHDHDDKKGIIMRPRDYLI